MKTHLIQIGNSRAVRLPRPLLEEAGLDEEVELKARQGAIIITPPEGPRSGWRNAARSLRERGEDRLLDPLTPTRFDAEE